jgi:hypothetical protein
MEIARLPSQDAAIDLVHHKPGAVGEVLGSMFLRAALIGAGLALAGFRGKQLVVGAASGAIAIEAFVLAWTYNEASKESTK